MADNVQKIESSISRVNTYCELLEKADRALRHVNSYPADKSLKLLNAIADKVKEIKVPKALHLSVKRINNELWSSIDYVQQGKRVSIMQFKPAIKEVKAYKTELLGKLENAKQGIKDWEAEENARFDKALTRASAESTNIVCPADQPWALCRAPVIPVCTIDIPALSRHFDVSNVGGYPVMHNQLVLGINRTLASKNGHTDVTTYRDNLIKAIARDRGLKLYNICERGMVRPESGASVFWFWLMTDHDARLFRQAFSTINRQGLATIHVKEWGFAC